MSQGVLFAPVKRTQRGLWGHRLYVLFTPLSSSLPTLRGGRRGSRGAPVRETARAGCFQRPAYCKKWRAARRGGPQAAGGAGPPELAAGPKAGRPAPETGPNAATAARAGAPSGAIVRSFRVYMSMENVHSPPGGQKRLTGCGRELTPCASTLAAGGRLGSCWRAALAAV